MDSITSHLVYSLLFVYLFADFTFSLFGISVLNSYKLPFYNNCPLQYTFWYVIGITLVRITMRTVNVNHPDISIYSLGLIRFNRMMHRCRERSTSEHNCLVSYLLCWLRHVSATVGHLQGHEMYIEENCTEYDHSTGAYCKLLKRSRCRLDYTYWAKSASSK